MLECCWHICQAKGHYIVLKVTVMCVEHCFLAVFLADVDVVVGITEVHFGKNFCSRQPVKHLTHQWKGVTVLECDAIKASVVNTQVQTTILFGHKHDWCASQTLGR